MRLRIALALVTAAALPALVLAAVPASAAVSHPAAQAALTAHKLPQWLGGGWQFQDYQGAGYWIDYPGKGYDIETQTSAHAAVYYPSDHQSWDGYTTYRWDAGTTGQCLTWNSTSGVFYEANCGEYPASQAIALVSGAYMVDQYATSKAGGGTLEGLGAVSDSNGSRVSTYNDTESYGANDWYMDNCCTAPRR